MYASRLTGFDDDGNSGTFLRSDQVIFNRRNGKKARYRNVVFIHALVRKNDDVVAVFVRSVHRNKKLVKGSFKRCADIIEQRDRADLEAGLIHGADFEHINVG